MKDREKTLEALKAQAAAEGIYLSDEIIELLKTVLDLEDRAYMAGYTKGLDDGYSDGFDKGYDAGRAARV